MTVPQTNRGEVILNMESWIVYPWAVWHVQRAGLIQPLVLCSDGEKTSESLSSHAMAKCLAFCCCDPYGSRWVQSHEWARGGPSGRRVMDLGLIKHQHLSQQRMMAECALQCVGRELVKL